MTTPPQPHESEEERVARVYTARGYDTDPEYADTNPVYLHRVQSMERGTLQALQAVGLAGRLGEIDLLDYGCGNGRWFGRWLAWGADPSRVCGVDIRPDAVARAAATFPKIKVSTLREGRIDHPNASFDVVVANLVFSSILQDATRQAAAADIERVLRPGGVALICDFVMDNPRNPDVRRCTEADLVRLFPACTTVFGRSLILAPPVARRIVPTSWSLGSALEAGLPFLRTHRVTALRKQGGAQATGA